MTDLGKINTDYWGYSQLIDFYQKNKDNWFGTVDLKLSDWFAAPACSMLGAIIFLLEKEITTVKLDPMGAKEILSRNGFLSFLGSDRVKDYNNTTISYQALSPSDHKFFNKYVMSELLERPDLPKMSALLKKKIAESIYEIFVNAQMHSKTEKIFTCGQFFPSKHTIEFMITDIGIGFAESLAQRFDVKVKPIQAISWAMKYGLTTKKNVSGGMGLTLLQEFIEKNNGAIQVVSGNGYWEKIGDKVEKREFSLPFPGTMVNIQVRTDDQTEYALAEENYINENDIF